jgi:hypothetical protein
MMKATILHLDKVKDLTKESRLKIEEGNNSLMRHCGARIEIIEISRDLIKVQVKNMNGSKMAKHKLLNNTYNILKAHLPNGYRISIKL